MFAKEGFVKLNLLSCAAALILGACEPANNPTEVRAVVPTPTTDPSTEQNSFAISTASELPICDNSRRGQLFFIEDVSQFEVCKVSGWAVINVRGADGSSGASLRSTSHCAAIRTLGGVSLSFNLDTFVMTNNDVIATCSLSDPRATYSRTVMYRHDQVGATNSYCNLTHDQLDGTLSGGFWEYQYIGGVPQVRYHDTGSAYDNQNYIFLNTECTVTQ